MSTTSEPARPAFLRPRVAKHLTGLSSAELRKLAAEGKLTAIRLGPRTWRYSAASIEALARGEAVAR